MKWFLVFLFVIQTGENTQKVVEGEKFEGYDVQPYASREACLERSKFFYQQTWEKLPLQILNIYSRCELRD